MITTKPVLTVGAGPTGMMAAIELNRFGVSVRLIDKLLDPATTSRAIGVQARTLELFEQRGLADAMLEAGKMWIFLLICFRPRVNDGGKERKLQLLKLH